MSIIQWIIRAIEMVALICILKVIIKRFNERMEKQISRDIAENVTLTAVYNILFTNDVVCGLVVDFISQLKKSPYYRFKCETTSQTHRE